MLEDDKLTFLRYEKIGPTMPMAAVFSTQFAHSKREQLFTRQMLEQRLANLKEGAMDHAETARVLDEFPKES